VNGNLFVEGSINTPSKPGTLSVSPAGFVCAYQGRDYINHGTFITNQDIIYSNEFNSAIQLPDGAIVTSLTSYWIDNNTSNATLQLKRVELLQGNTTTMATMNTSWNSTTYHSATTNTVSSANIDNANYYYFLTLDIPATNQIMFAGAKIEYTVNTIK
jgi:hypothetical protein